MIERTRVSRWPLQVVFAALVVVLTPPELYAGESCSIAADFGATFFGVEVSPEQPRVGDTVEIRFDVDVFALSAEWNAYFVGGAPNLVEVPVRFSQDVVFQTTALLPGSATVQLEVAYSTEWECRDEEGNFLWYSLGSDTDFSPEYEIEITPLLPPEGSVCIGDCNDDQTVGIAEVLTCVNLGLGHFALDTCSVCDADADGEVSIADVLTAMNFGLGVFECG